MTELGPGFVDHAIVVDEDRLLLAGWLKGVGRDASARLKGSGRRGTPVELDYGFRRPDVEALAGGASVRGFVCLAEAPGAAGNAARLRLEVGDAGGAGTALEIPEPVHDPVAGRELAFHLLGLGRPDGAFYADQGHPAIEGLRQRIDPAISARAEERGTVPTGTAVSVIIPVYGALDLLSPQVALLAEDPELREAEIVIVLDSPELAEEFLSLTTDLNWLYGLPIRAVIMDQNAGFAHANNAAVARATGEHLLFLNSDVFPERRGWLETMLAAHRADGGAAATGPKLLYEDGALQHAGMHFERERASGDWRTLHFHKGMPGTLPAANEARVVPALTGACLLVGRAEFQAVGGFDPAYVLGGFEDSDLCMRLQESGRQCRYEPGAELVHLERQSFASRSDALAGDGRLAYNRWLFTQRWDDRVGRLMAELG